MKLKVKTPFSYILLIFFFCLVGFFFLLLSDVTGIIDINDVFFFLSSAIIGWISLILLALIGAIFVGMFLSHRLLSIGGFTPFEEEMLKMRKDIEAINEKLEVLVEHENVTELEKNKGTDEEDKAEEDKGHKGEEEKEGTD